MSMQQFKKTISLDVEPGTVSERIVESLPTSGRRGKAMQLMREWLSAGKLLDECGDGIMQYLISIDKHGMNQKEMVASLTTYLQRIGTDIHVPASDQKAVARPEKEEVKQELSAIPNKTRRSLAAE